MFVDILLLLVGFALVTLGAEGLVEGASGIARKLGISEFVIGLTIVAIGTSAPEMVVSVIGAVEGNSDVCAGNVLGSNIFNSLMVLGITAMAFPVIITKANKKVDLPVYFGFSLLVFLFAKSDTLFGIGSGSITRPIGIIMLVLFATYIFFSFKNQKAPEQEAGSDKKEWKTWIYILLSVLGLGGLVFGGRLFVDSAVSIAKQAGLSDKFIAVTILAIGTSLPEFATNIVAIIKKKSQLALGNILGSNIFNMLLVLGTASTITPISFERMSLIDFGAILLGALVIWSPAFSGRMRISRVEGSCLLLLEAGYLVYIFVNL